MNPKIAINGGPGKATIKLTESNAAIIIEWDDGGLAAGNKVEFTFDAPASDFALNEATWLGNKGTTYKAFNDITGIPKE